MNLRPWIAKISRSAMGGVIALALGGAGCAGYRVGSMLPGDIRTVHVPVVVNRTDEPLLEPEVTRAVLSRIQFDGSLRVADAATADSVLNIELTSFRTDGISFRGERDASPSEYRSRIDARFSLVNRKTGETMVQSRTIGEATFEADGDLMRAKTDSVPEASIDLARRIVAMLVEAW